jgi:hypothetical protein
MIQDDHMQKIFDNEDGLTWEQRLDFFLKAVNDVSKALNEAAQSSKILHTAIGDHNELLTMIFYLIASHFYEEEVSSEKRSVIMDFLSKAISAKNKDKGPHEEEKPKVSE